MPSLKDLKNRINSVKSTRKITSAMKMVAAAKLRRAQEAAEAARPFAERMETVLGNLSKAAKDSPTAPKLLAGTGADQVHMLIVATSERGLCGGFNSQIVRQVRQDILRLTGEGKTIKILTIGKKGREQLKRDYEALMVDHIDLSGVKKLAYENAAEIAADILKRFDAEEFDIATLYFNKFVSVLTQEPTPLQLIPAVFEDDGSDGTNYEYEPEEEEILADLLPRNIATQVFRGLLENAASEQGSRMTAMDNATRNAGEMIDKLTIQYNRSRQAAITSELIEIISGAEAL
ncbi:MAG: F0F1 ATP synthase subunit gamma [Pseudomonadota bacterium]